MPAAGVMSRHGGPPYSRRLAAALSRLDALIDWERSVRAAGAHRRMRVSSAPCGDLLARLGSPQSRLPVAVHITGSKGKGSVAALTAAALSAAGYRTGVTPNAAHGATVDGSTPAAAVPNGRGATHPPVHAAADASWFDVMTAAGFLTLATAGVDAAAVEVGLGGALDSTAVLSAPVAVLTNVYDEHAAIIGPTLVDIATEKAGIVARGGRLITGVPPGSAVAAAIERVVRSRRAAGVTYVCLEGDDLSIDERNAALAGEVLDQLGRNGHSVRRPSAAVGSSGAPPSGSGAERGGGPISSRLLDWPGVRAAAAAALPGRMELFSIPLPPVADAAVAATPPPSATLWVGIDGGHVPDSVAAAAVTVGARVADAGGPSAVTVVLGLGMDKDASGIVAALRGALPGITRFVCTTVARSEVYLQTEELAAAVRQMGGNAAVEVAPDPLAALELALKRARGGGDVPPSWVLFSGSLHLAGAASKRD
ncbi:hypothetical protein I4F81_009652 [Pyropia yezoensis]|uniref:Uncharacterized protein n=1 Tax=Pyropia yezoensis TaxID=2788 RepID=A0ACC3CAP1_PYRYE|nr:hypothetical protein I4F81_009652 [Neopyropia yezoensis]